MQKAQDFTKVMQDMAGKFPFDQKAFQDQFRSTAVLGERVAKVALEAAEKSSEISAKWTRDALLRVGTLTRVQGRSGRLFEGRVGLRRRCRRDGRREPRRLRRKSRRRWKPSS